MYRDSKEDYERYKELLHETNVIYRDSKGDYERYKELLHETNVM